jgi:hypothetical protein
MAESDSYTEATRGFTEEAEELNVLVLPVFLVCLGVTDEGLR